jgi:hypothetical protein
MNTQSTSEIFNSHNKAIEAKIIQKCKDTPIITKHFTTAYDDAYNEPIVNLNQKQKSTLKNLLDEN